jgi:hypothetical protein
MYNITMNSSSLFISPLLQVQVEDPMYAVGDGSKFFFCYA